MLPSLEVEFAGVRMRSPMGVSAMSPLQGGGADGEKLAAQLMRIVSKGAGYVYTPVIFSFEEKEHPKDKPPTGRLFKIESGRGLLGFFSAGDEKYQSLRLNTALKAVRALKQKLPDKVPLVADIMGPGADPKGWANFAKIFEEEGADLIELDVSTACTAGLETAVEQFSTGDYSSTHFEGVGPGGVLLGDDIPRTVAIAKEVVKNVSIPVGVKFTPETGYPRIIGFAKQLKEAGVKFVTSNNCFTTIAPPDIYNGGKPLYPFLDVNPITTTGGPWVRHALYRNIGTIALFVPGLDQAAVGGLTSPENIVEVIMLGANICETCSGILFKGFNFISTCVSFLESYMNKCKYDSVDDFRGLGLKYVKPLEDVDWHVGDIAAYIDPDKCTGCSICYENHCYAISMDKGKARVNPEECTGCGVCLMACPSGAIEIRRIK